MTEPEYLTLARTAYDTVAEDYAAMLRDELARNPHDRAVLGLFAELVSGKVVDAGCGPGRISGHLAGLGVDVHGVDLSPAMVGVARREFPALEFAVGSLLELDEPDGALGGVVAWYSVIHVPRELHATVFAGFHRVLAPGGLLQLAFQVGDISRRLEQGYGHEIALDVHRLRPDVVAGQLVDAGFTVVSTVERAAVAPEKAPQAYVLARRNA
ncbi:class I SAM-dependent methyltransferase [Saccharothrix violaceirubra]|uniref:SAM-dependent methyltransferase n=1 Tax=Saccharothrix violaceirubra TaxID=413306 RepID=A0A7W7TAM8_9PSEU|nr:class I SAM-dependent methyltransferase [Saccharothrix violaceirubra]MBB4969551.1 SAM-dependent methyltransferase [Saccharothrix violaceirubra]